jgi:hypothetical protein
MTFYIKYIIPHTSGDSEEKNTRVFPRFSLAFYFSHRVFCALMALVQLYAHHSCFYTDLSDTTVRILCMGRVCIALN